MRTFAHTQRPAQEARSASSARPGRAFSGQSREVSSILHLQRTIGNQAVQRLLQANAEKLEAGSTTTASTRLLHDFSRIPLYAKAHTGIQPKLTISTPRDIYEQEADRVADRVMGMPEPQLQRVCACGGGCPQCGKQKDAQEQIQTKPVQGITVAEPTAPASVEKVLSSLGRPLDSSTRAFFEPRFGRDFSQVRVHSDTPAAESAKVLNAQAYTVGNHIVFGEKDDAPTRQSNLQLLAHELTHVVQQGAQRRVIQRRPSPDSTNYAFDTYRVTAAHLSDPDIVSRFESLPLSHLIQYRNRISDPAVIAYIDQLLTDRLNAMTLDQLFADVASEKDPAVRSYIDQWLTTHAPTSYEIALGTKKPGEAEVEMEASGISVKVLPDEFVDAPTFKSIANNISSGKVTENTKGITVYDPKWHPRWIVTHGRVTSVKPIIQVLRIKTVYLRETSRMTQSGYGVGTRAEDVKTSRTTLAHHEGSHAACFIQYVKDNAPPMFTGRVDDRDTWVIKKAQTFNTAMEKYYADMAALCGPAVDCTGRKATFCP